MKKHQSIPDKHSLPDYAKVSDKDNVIGGSFYFDWQWRDSGVRKGVIDVFQSDFKLEANDFIIKQVKDHFEAYNERYGIYFTHDFKFTTSTSLEQKREFNEQFSEVYKKYRYLTEKTKKVLNGNLNVLFVLSGPLETDEAIQLSRTLRSQFLLKHFKILHIPFRNFGNNEVEHPDIISRAIDNTSNSWQGNNKAWDLAFNDIHISPPTCKITSS